MLTYIAVVEAAAIVMGFDQCSDCLSDRDVVWFEDNSAALSSIVKGGSHNIHLDRAATAVRMLEN